MKLIFVLLFVLGTFAHDCDKITCSSCVRVPNCVYISSNNDQNSFQCIPMSQAGLYNINLLINKRISSRCAKIEEVYQKLRIINKSLKEFLLLLCLFVAFGFQSFVTK